MTTTEVTTAAPVVRFDQVSKTYGNVRAVDGLSLELRPGETVALLGPNGAGKSTTLDLLLGLKRPDGGTVGIFGTSPREAIVAGRVGAMLQSGGLMDEVTVAELVRLACELHPRAYRPGDVMARAGVTKIADRKVDKLSGGQVQRVRFALATAGDSDLIVLDEPTTGMDVSARQAFWATMREQADQGRTVLFATHYLEEADAVADRVLVLHRGRLLADGTAAEIKAKAGARRVSFDLEGKIDEAALRRLPFVNSLTLSGGTAPANDASANTGSVNDTSAGTGTGSANDASANTRSVNAGSASGASANTVPSSAATVGGVHTVRIQTADADATVHALYGLGVYPRNLEVSGLGLEQAFVALTQAEEARETERTTRVERVEQADRTGQSKVTRATKETTKS